MPQTLSLTIVFQHYAESNETIFVSIHFEVGKESVYLKTISVFVCVRFNW